MANLNSSRPIEPNEGLPLPPPPPMTSDEIVGHIRDHWVQNIGANWDEANMRAERGFWHLLQTGALREWGFDHLGDLLYECHTPVAQTIVYVLVPKEGQ
jgi:hypothetical protein